MAIGESVGGHGPEVTARGEGLAAVQSVAIPTVTIPAYASKLKASQPPKDANPVYVQRYYESLSQCHVALMWVTPDLAKTWLEKNNLRNRPLTGWWKKLRDKISSLLWHVNGESIVFSTENIILNGQHRLQAIANGSEPVPVFVFYGIHPDAFSTYDQGRRRGGADILALLGQEGTSALNGAITWAVRFQRGQMGTTTRVSIPNEQIAEWLEAFPGLPASVMWARERKTKLVPVGLLSYIHHAFTEHAPEHAPDFFEKVIDGVGVTRPSWHKSLRNRLEGDLAGQRTDWDQIHIAALLIITFNRVITGEPCRELIIRGKESQSLTLWRPETQAFPKLADPPFSPASAHEAA